MNVLIGCEFSGVVRDAFCKRGHNAWSCDLLQGDGKHIQKDVMEVVKEQYWDMFIVHPPCTYLCSSGLHWNKRRVGRQEKTDQALDFVRELMAVNIPKICIENPVGCIGTKIKKASQYIQPYQFGHDASKKTGLWLKGLPLLQGTGFVSGRLVEGKIGGIIKRTADKTGSRHQRTGGKNERRPTRELPLQWLNSGAEHNRGV